MAKLNNTRKNDFLERLNSRPSIEDKDNLLVEHCKFNFSFLTDDQEPCGKLDNGELLANLMDKLRSYSLRSLDYWQKQGVGSKRQTVLEVYKTFPTKTKFKEPKGIPHEALWARFRMDSKKRLIGFVLPPEYANKQHESGYYFDVNTFYVVFLDPLHQFYLINKS